MPKMQVEVEKEDLTASSRKPLPPPRLEFKQKKTRVVGWEWRKFKIVRDTLNEMVREKLAGATAKLVDATPRIADMLIAVALDPRSKPYSRVAAADLVFRTVATHLLESNQQEQISAIREQLEQLEAGGPILDV